MTAMATVYWLVSKANECMHYDTDQELCWLSEAREDLAKIDPSAQIVLDETTIKYVIRRAR